MEQSERLQKTLSELKTSQERLDQLDKDQAALLERLDKARRAQRRITYYLIALVISCSILGAIALYLLAKTL